MGTEKNHGLLYEEGCWEGQRGGTIDMKGPGQEEYPWQSTPYMWPDLRQQWKMLPCGQGTGRRKRVGGG